MNDSCVDTHMYSMAFGFVVVKFSLFVKQISLILGKENTIHRNGYSGISQKGQTECCGIEVKRYSKLQCQRDLKYLLIELNAFRKTT
jgi:hypothetical protein